MSSFTSSVTTIWYFHNLEVYFTNGVGVQVSKEAAMLSVYGYTVANDLSARDWQMKR
jgi:2-keto-4-pentenoate hydratase/2-oxohepta-3-ene-1,7-dioic acid hydratase in catechol pathway